MSDDLLTLLHVSKMFNRGTVNETQVFSDFNLSIRRGEFVSVVGSNGSGKTTMLNLICGSFPVDSGQILLEGEDMARLSEYQRARRIGRVFQDPSKGTCPELTILENMSLADHKGKRYGLGCGVDKKRSDFYCSQLELLHLGLEDKLGIKVGALSGGQRQALALLIATMTPIDLLILDEHTAALDPKSSENVMELTERFVREKELTALMVTHNLRFAVNYGNRLIMMHSGKAVIDAAGEERAALKVENLLTVFNEISIECGN